MQPVLSLDLAVPVEHPERLRRGVRLAHSAAPNFSGFEHKNSDSTDLIEVLPDVARGLC